MSDNPNVYHSGDCTVISYGPFHYELHWHHKFVANFRTFRAAVKYLFEEFG